MSMSRRCHPKRRRSEEEGERCAMSKRPKGKREEETKYVAVALTDALSESSVRSTRSCPKRSDLARTSPALTSAICRHCRPPAALT